MLRFQSFFEKKKIKRLRAAGNEMSDVYLVTVKWGKQVFRKVELDTSETALDFKVKLFSLTQVPPERQKSKPGLCACPRKEAENGVFFFFFFFFFSPT